MGLPAGWVTALIAEGRDPRPHGISRSQALGALGNGIVRHQFAYALTELERISGC
jgi:hypothetical protein